MPNTPSRAERLILPFAVSHPPTRIAEAHADYRVLCTDALFGFPDNLQQELPSGFADSILVSNFRSQQYADGSSITATLSTTVQGKFGKDDFSGLTNSNDVFGLVLDAMPKTRPGVQTDALRLFFHDTKQSPPLLRKEIGTPKSWPAERIRQVLSAGGIVYPEQPGTQGGAQSNARGNDQANAQGNTEGNARGNVGVHEVQILCNLLYTLKF